MSAQTTLGRIREWAERKNGLSAGGRRAADEVLAILNTGDVCCCYDPDCPVHGTDWTCGDCGKTWRAGVYACVDCERAAAA